MKKILLWFSILILVWLFVRFVIGGSEDSWICVDGQWVKHGAPSAPKPQIGCGEEIEVANPEASPRLIGGDKDEHGCMLMAGYTWCEPKQKCLREWEEACDK